MRHVILVVAAAAAMALAGCADTRPIDPPVGQKAKITSDTMAFFKDSYQRQIGSTHPGAFAVSSSGRQSAYTYCEEIMCRRGASYAQRAIELCERDGEPCYLFAIGNEIRVEYDIVD